MASFRDVVYALQVRRIREGQGPSPSCFPNLGLLGPFTLWVHNCMVAVVLVMSPAPFRSPSLQLGPCPTSGPVRTCTICTTTQKYQPAGHACSILSVATPPLHHKLHQRLLFSALRWQHSASSSCPISAITGCSLRSHYWMLWAFPNGYYT